MKVFRDPRTVRFALLLTGSFLLCGCEDSGEPHIDIVKRYSPQYRELRAELADLAKLIPEKVTPSPVGRVLDPMPVFMRRYGRLNGRIVMYEQLLNPEINLEKAGLMNFLQSGNLMRNLRWTGPANPMTEEMKQENSDSERIERQLRFSLGIRYLGVVRTYKHVRAKALNKEEFEEGSVIMGVFLIDREKQAVIAQGIIQAQSDHRVNDEHAEPGDSVAGLENWANSSLWVNAKAAVIAKFAEMTGAASG